MTETSDAGRALRIERCRLAASNAPWAYAERNAAAIDAHWRRAQISRPKLFNGVIYLMREYALDADTLTGTLVRTDFKSFLHWRENGYDDPEGTRDAFGASIIRSAEGHVLLGVQTAGHLNAGLAYPPSGMIDADDVRGDSIDIEASIARELTEETGLAPADLQRTPGFVVTLMGPFIAIGIEWRSKRPAHELRQHILAHNEAQAEPELADVVIVRSQTDMARQPVQAHTIPMLRFLLPA
jgi:hypothetical protein